MPTMRASVDRSVDVAGRRYRAAAGETVDVHPDDVERLRPFGFVDDDGPGDDGPGEESNLEDATLGELRELARARDLEGRSKMSREELLEALRGDPGQEA